MQLGINPFAYAGQNPTQNIDPSGLSFIKSVKWIIHNGKRIGTATTGTIGFKTAVRLRQAGKDCKVIANNEEEARRLAKEIETTAHPEGELLDHPKDAHVRSGNQPHFQTSGIKGHTFYSVASLLAATTYLGDGFMGQAVDFFNPFSIPKDVMDIYDDVSGPDSGGGCMCEE